MAHRSGGGSHSGGHHSGGGHHSSSHGGSGGSAPRYSNRPFPRARRFRYYDRRGRERYLYGSEMPKKASLFSLIFPLIFFIPFILGGIFSVVSFLITLMPTKPLRPEYEPTDVHIMDGAGVIDDEDSLEDILQEFEDETGISPYVMTVYDEDWMYYDELWNYAYEIYINSFTDEQHFLIVYSEPENAAELDFVDWSWEGIQGDETDPILTESKVERFGDDLHDNLLRNNVSVGEAFEKAFKKSLTYMMKRENNGDIIATLLFAVIWNVFIISAVVGVIRSYIIGKREYQEVPIGGSANTVPGAMGGNNTAYQNGTTFQNGTAYQSGAGVPYQNQTTFQGDPNYQSGQIYQSDTGIAKKYMYYDKNGNKKYDSVPYSYAKSSALVIMIIVLIIAVPILFFSAFLLFGLILMVSTATDAETVSSIIPMLIGVSIWNVAVIAGIVCAIRHYKNVKNRQYFEVSNDNSVNYGNNIPNNNAAQYNSSMQSNTVQYNSSMQNNTSQYNTEAQYNTADSDFYNDDSRFRSPEYYDDDARYRGSTAYESGKK